MGRGVVVVTGGTAGVGRATSVAFAEAGYDVAVLARGRKGLDSTVEQLRGLGVRAHAITCDVSDAEAVDAAAGEAERELGPIDIWVNNAFVGVFAYFWDVTPAEFKRVTEVTYLGQVHGTMAALARMRPRDSGVIVNVGSALAYRGIPLQAAYCGSKHAIVGFTESLAAELANTHSRIRVCMAQLPGMNTPQFDWVVNKLPQHPQPVPPIYEPEVAAQAIVHLAEHPRRSIWVGVSTAATILGNRFAPRLLDLYLGRDNVSAQQVGDISREYRPNLWEPVDVDPGPHGDFAGESVSNSRLTRFSQQLVSPVVRRCGFLAPAAVSAVAFAENALGKIVQKVDA